MVTDKEKQLFYGLITDFKKNVTDDFLSFVKAKHSNIYDLFLGQANDFNKGMGDLIQFVNSKDTKAKEYLNSCINDEDNYVFVRQFIDLNSEYKSFKEVKNTASSTRLFQNNKEKDVIKGDLRTQIEKKSTSDDIVRTDSFIKSPKLFNKTDTVGKPENTENKKTVKLFQDKTDKKVEVKDSKEIDFNDLKPDTLLLRIEKKLIEFIGQPYITWDNVMGVQLMRPSMRVMIDAGIIHPRYSPSTYQQKVLAIIELHKVKRQHEVELEKMRKQYEQ